MKFGFCGTAQQAEESVDRTLVLDDPQYRYEDEYGGVQYAKHRLACRLFERLYVTAKTVANMLDIERSTAYRATDDLEEEGILKKIMGKQRSKEYRAKEIFNILERPPQTY